MLNSEQFAKLVIRPTLEKMGLYSKAAEQLLLGTAITESRLRHLHQLGGGPALGLFQMEPATHNDIWKNYLAYKPKFSPIVTDIAGGIAGVKADNMIGNLYYAAAMARMHYLRVPEKLPEAGNVVAMAEYWKKYYNTPLGAGTVAKATPHFKLAVVV